MPNEVCKESKPTEWISGDFTLECPISHYRDYYRAVDAASHYRNGHLPHSGGWADQPAILMQLIGIFNG